MDIKKEFEKRQENIIKDLRGLIAVPSIAVETKGEYPFGEDVNKALTYMLDLGKSMGFKVKNVDNYGGHIDFPGTGEGVAAFVGHLDVVPVGEGWSVDPFGGEIKDGYIYGRGTQDDKGPTIISLYAMKILKEMGHKPKQTIRLILGLDEETNWDGIRYYLDKEKAPDFGIVPDGDFPLIQCEKGLMQFELVKSTEERSLLKKDGVKLENFVWGQAPNVIPGKVDFDLTGDKGALDAAKKIISEKAKSKGYKIQISEKEKKLNVLVEGSAAHAAYPEKGTSAVGLAMEILSGVDFKNQNAEELVAFYNNHIGLTKYGENMGCGFEDELSGRLTLSIGGVSLNDEQTKIVMDSRYPVTKKKEDVYEGIAPIIKEAGFGVNELDHIEGIYQDSDSPIVKTLLSVYREITGDNENQPEAIGGATFARAIPNCLAFGALFPGDVETEHQKDERIKISQLLKAGHIYAEAMYRLTK